MKKTLTKRDKEMQWMGIGSGVFFGGVMVHFLVDILNFDLEISKLLVMALGLVSLMISRFLKQKN